MRIIKSSIEQVYDAFGVRFPREAFAAAYAVVKRDPEIDRGIIRVNPRPRPSSGLKPAGSEGFVFRDLQAQDRPLIRLQRDRRRGAR